MPLVFDIFSLTRERNVWSYKITSGSFCSSVHNLVEGLTLMEISYVEYFRYQGFFYVKLEKYYMGWWEAELSACSILFNLSEEGGFFFPMHLTLRWLEKSEDSLGNTNSWSDNRLKCLSLPFCFSHEFFSLSLCVALFALLSLSLHRNLFFSA